MDLIRKDCIKSLEKRGLRSQQLICPENSASDRVTVTLVTAQPDATNVRHRHESSEQIWIALEGASWILLAGSEVVAFHAGDVVRFEADEVHGLQNDSDGAFVYLAVTAPPINFRSAYE